jgi:hypothetical protein
MVESTTTVVTVPRARVTRRDWASAALVVLLTLVALAVGLALRSSVENRSKSYTDSSGVTLHYPESWQLSAPKAAGGTVLIRDLSAKGYPTTLGFSSVAVNAQAQDADALSVVANNLAISRGQDLTSYKLFGVTSGQTIKGMPGAKTRYVFVDTPANAFQQAVPAVVRGDDYLVRKGANVYVFSLNTTDENRADALPIFERFVETAQLP